MKNNLSEKDMKKIKKERFKQARVKLKNKQLPKNFFENILNYEMILSNGFDPVTSWSSISICPRPSPGSDAAGAKCASTAGPCSRSISCSPSSTPDFRAQAQKFVLKSANHREIS